MKKNFFKKKLASGLALALVVASLAPAGLSASAATATKIVKQDKSKAPTVLYVGNKGTDYSLSNTYKTNTYNWKISDSKIATINAKTGVVTPKAPGTVTIRVTARNAKTNKWLKDFTMKIYVKQRATTVDIGSDDFSLAIGAEKDLNAVKAPLTSTDVIVYASSDEKVATVDAKTGIVKAVAPGEATITVYSKGLSSSAITSQYNRTDAVKVTVLDGLQSVKQTTTTKVELTLASDESAKLTKDNVTITDANGIKQIIKEVSFSTDGKVATVELFIALVDKGVYKVAYGDNAKDFTASVGAVAKVELAAKTVKYGDATNLGIKLFDANGIDVTTDDEIRNNVTFDYDAGKAYVAYDATSKKHQITVFNFPESVTVKAIYHTYKYDGATETVYESTAVINSVEKLPSLAAGIKYTVTSGNADWDKLSTSIPAKSTNYKLFLKAKDKNDNDLTEADFTFESSDVNVLTVSKSSAGVVTLYGAKAGTAYIKATYGDTTQMLLVTVGGEAKATAITLDKTSVTVYDSLLNEDETVTFTAKDQYGNTMPVESATYEATNSASPFNVSVNNNKISFSLAAPVARTTTYVYRVTYYGRTYSVSVTASHVDPTSVVTSIRLDASTTDTTIDAVYKDSVTADKTVVYKAYGYNSAGQKVSIVPATYTVKKGTDAASASTSYFDQNAGVATFSALQISGNVVTKAAVATYVVTATYTLNGVNYVNSKTITVTDSQEAITATRKEATVQAGTVLSAIESGIKFSTDVTIVGVTANVGGTSVALNDGTDVNTTLFISKVVVQRTIGSKLVQQEVTVNLGFPVK